MRMLKPRLIAVCITIGLILGPNCTNKKNPTDSNIDDPVVIPEGSGMIQVTIPLFGATESLDNDKSKLTSSPPAKSLVIPETGWDSANIDIKDAADNLIATASLTAPDNSTSIISPPGNDLVAEVTLVKGGDDWGYGQSAPFDLLANETAGVSVFIRDRFDKWDGTDNDVSDRATAILTGVIYEDMSLEPLNDEDWYNINLTNSGTTYKIDTSVEDGSEYVDTDTVIEVWDADGNNMLAQSDDTDFHDMLLFTPTATADYKIRIFLSDNLILLTGNYRLRVSDTSGDTGTIDLNIQ